MAEHVVENVRLLEIIEARGRADEVAGREAAAAQMAEEDVVGNEAGHGHHSPAGSCEQPFVDLVEARDAWMRQAKHIEPAFEVADRPACKPGLLASEEQVPDPVIVRREQVPPFGDGPVLGFLDRVAEIGEHRGFSKMKNPARSAGRGGSEPGCVSRV